MDSIGCGSLSFIGTKASLANIEDLRVQEMCFFYKIGRLGAPVEFTSEIETGESVFFKYIRPLFRFKRDTIRPRKAGGYEPDIVCFAACFTDGHFQLLIRVSYFTDLIMPVTIYRVIVNQAHGLHEGITDCRSYKLETSFLQISAHGP